MPLELTNLPVADALCASLETMAFISPEPCAACDGAAAAPPAEGRRVTIAFKGPTSGTIELLTPIELGMTLAANLLVCDPGDPMARDHAGDVLKELANVTCGALINGLDGVNPSEFELQIPQIDDIGPDVWANELAGDGFQCLNAEGHVIAVRVR